MSIMIYNTLTRKKEGLQTLKPKQVKMYVCGPTVYNYIHIGNARVFVFFDVVRRYLVHKGYQVTYVQNFTDVDDRLIEAAQEQGISVPKIAEKYIAAYFEDMDALGVHRADVHPKATEHIEEMLEAIRILIQKGYAYEREGDVYYRAQRKDDYGKLSHQSLEELKAGARIEVDERKESPLDFALWKRVDNPEEISWESPWGPGRPGWHIECSVMSNKYLGTTLDIHAGGADLCFPHHENEIAQSEALNDALFARFWMHNGYLNIEGEKMSKSLGNFIRVHDLRQKIAPRVIRFFLLSVHYRHPIQFGDEPLQAAENGLKRIDTAITNLRHRKKTAIQGPIDEEVRQEIMALRLRFEQAMDDDFNSANGISVLFDAVRFANECLSREVITEGTIEGILDWFTQFGGEILGLVDRHEEDLPDKEVETLIEERQQARQVRNFARADEIRDLLERMGIILEDTPQGVRWRRK